MTETSMIPVYRAPSAIDGALLVEALEAEGIPAKTVGGQANLAFGELPADALLVEVWVDEEHVARARQIIASARRDESNRAPWTCSDCEELNEGNMSLCWNCQTPRQAG